MWLRVGIVLLGAGVVLSGCGASGSGGPTTSATDLGQAKAFTDYPLYYLGSSFHGLPLTAAELGPGSGTRRRRSWSFIYGSCTPSGGDEPSCVPPLEVQNWSICTRFPAIYSGPTPKTSPEHGAETLPAGGGLDVYTGHTTVVIFGGDESSVIRSLRRVSDDVNPNPLPAPVPGSLEGSLRCQASALERVSH